MTQIRRHQKPLLFGYAQKSINVRADVIATFSQPYDQRRVLFNTVKMFWIMRRQQDDGIGSLNLFQRFQECPKHHFSGQRLPQPG